MLMFLKNWCSYLGVLCAVMFLACTENRTVAGTTEEPSANVGGEAGEPVVVPDTSWKAEFPGAWSVISSGGTSGISWPDVDGEVLSKEWMTALSRSCGGICGSVKLDASLAQEESFVGIRMDASAEDGDGNAYYPDVSGWGRLCLAYASDLDIEVGLNLGDSLNGVLKNDLPSAMFKKTRNMNRESSCVPWDEFKQKNGDVMTGVKASSHIKALDVKFVGQPGDEGDFLISLIGRDTVFADSVVLEPMDTVIASGTITIKENGTMWRGIDGLDWVDTEFEGSRGDAGHLTFFNDSVYGGGSTIIWPTEIGTEYDELSLQPVIESCSGICGTVSFVEDYENRVPDVGIEFNVAGMDNSGEYVAVDVTERWDGLCFAYTSETNVFLELIPGDSVAALLDGGIAKINIGASFDSTYGCVLFSDITDASGVSIGVMAAKNLKKVRLRFQRVARNSYDFNIMKIGYARREWLETTPDESIGGGDAL